LEKKKEKKKGKEKPTFDFRKH